jgi:RNA polymerase sigma-70 factor (ECF subfamily)
VPLSPEQELGLLARARSPSIVERERAFRAIFDSLRAQIFATSLHIVGSASDAEDAIQECFIAVHQGLAAFRGESRLSTWVFRIAIRSALAVRARRSRGHVPLDHADAVPSQAPGPDDAAHANEELRSLQRALGELSSEHRVVLSLFAVEGLGHTEIAEILGIPSGTIWSRLHLARRRLAQAMGRPPA